MSRMLNMADRLLERGRTLQQLGQTSDALRLLGRLTGLRDLPPEIAEDAEARLAQMALDRCEYRNARRHLTAALVRRPTSAHYHYLMAGAWDADPRGDSERALHHYRKSLEIDADQPRCLAERGLLALRLGKTEEGLASLRKAVSTAPNDPEAAASLASGLRELGQDAEARCVLLTALFHNPRDYRFRRLWIDFRFREACEDQVNGASAEALSGTHGPTLLPFRRPLGGAEPTSRFTARIRHDGPVPLPPPHQPGRPAGYPGRKHA